MGFFGKIGEGLRKTRDSLMNSMNAVLHSFTKIDEELFEELEEILIMSDTGAGTAARICETLRAKVKEQGETDPEKIRGLLAQTAADMLRGGQELALATKPDPLSALTLTCAKITCNCMLSPISTWETFAFESGGDNCLGSHFPQRKPHVIQRSFVLCSSLFPASLSRAATIPKDKAPCSSSQHSAFPPSLVSKIR